MKYDENSGSKMYSFRLFIDEMERVKLAAKKQRASVSEYIRLAIRHALAESEKKK